MRRIANGAVTTHLLLLRPCLSVLVMSLLLAACSPTARVEVPSTHPASPQAEEAPVPALSIAFNAPVRPLPALPEGKDASEHHHAGHGTSGQVPTSTPATPAPAPAAEDHSQHAPAATKP